MKEESKRVVLKENGEDYVSVDEKLISKKNKVIWKKSIGTHLIGRYKGISFDFEIVDYKSKENKVTILYNGETKEINYRNIANFNLNTLFGFRNPNFRYEINQRLVNYNEDGTIKRDFTIIDRKKEKDTTGHSWKYYKIKCNVCGFDSGINYLSGKRREEYWIREDHISKGHGCGCCDNQFCVTGINDMWTTNPNLAELLADEEDGYKYIQGTTIKLNFKCPLCKSVYKKNPDKVIQSDYKVPCNCNDGVSYPEKFMWSVLNMLNVDYIWQYSKTNCDWIKNKSKYDFYFEHNNEKYIIETHGEQHYQNSFSKIKRARTLEEEQKNDRIKKELAFKNGIKEENYIVIDCRKSDMEWIKNNILHSSLNKLFDLNQVDWLKCSEYACKNIYKEICDIWNDLGDKKSTTMIEENTKFSKTTIITALKKGNELGWCDYNPNVNYRNDIYLKVTDLEDNLLGVYRGYKDLQDCSEEQFGKFLRNQYLFNVINRNDENIGNIKITLTTKDFYEENKNTKIFYQFKKQCYVAKKGSTVAYFKTGKECAEYINKKENVKTRSSSVFNAILCLQPLYGYIIERIFLSEEEIKTLNN